MFKISYIPIKPFVERAFCAFHFFSHRFFVCFKRSLSFYIS